jgi:hypothetical protein
VTRSIIVDATRCWREAQDSRQPVQPALFQALTVHRCGVLSPAIDSALRLYERCAGRRLRTSAPGQPGLSGDEQALVELLAGPDRDDAPLGSTAAASPGLLHALRIALRSLRAMLRLTIDPIDFGPRLCLAMA